MAKTIKSQQVIQEQKCKTCMSPFRDVIEAKKIVDEMSLHALIQWCKDELDFSISYGALQNHFANHMNAKREVQVRYRDGIRKEKEAGLPDPDNEVEIKLHTLKHLDNSIIESAILQTGASLELQAQLAQKIPKFFKIFDEQGKHIRTERIDRAEINTAIVQLFKTCSEEIRQGMKAKAEILGIDEQSSKEDQQAQLMDLIVTLGEAQLKNFQDDADMEEVSTINFDDEDEDVIDLEPIKESEGNNNE